MKLKLLFSSNKVLFLAAGITLLLSSCAKATPTPDIAGTAAAMAEVMVDSKLTAIAMSEPSSTPLPPSETPAPTAAMTQPPVVENTPAPGNATDNVCLRAYLAAEDPVDNTLMTPGEYFEKTWTLTNTGTCTWTDEYHWVFHHGNSMNASTRVALPGYVAPGDSFTFSLYMNAPVSAGTHVGFWMLESADGTLFGWGDNGLSAFWAQIVVPGATPTSKARSLGVSTGGTVYSDGKVDGTIFIGDNAANDGAQGFATYSFGNLSQNAEVTAVIMDLTSYTLKGDPFSLGCLNVYQAHYGGLDASDYDSEGTLLWRFCSTSDFTSTHYGDATVIAAVEDALSSGQIQFVYQFESDGNLNDTPDAILPAPVLHIYWYSQ